MRILIKLISIVLLILAVSVAVYFILIYKKPSFKIILEYCWGQPSGTVRTDGLIVTVLKNSDGYIGGYRVNWVVGDSPISYLDPDGNEIAVFHIFGDEEENIKAVKIIDNLKKKFPVEESLVCP